MGILRLRLLWLGRPPANEKLLQAFQHQFAALIEHGAAQCHHAGSAAGCQLRNLERGIDRIVGEHGFQEPARLFEKTDQRFLHHKGKQPAAGCSVDQGLETMREQVRHAAGAAIFDVVMNGMGIAARGLKRGEDGRRHGAAGNDKALAQRKILEPALLRHHAMQCGIELGHGWFPATLRFMRIAEVLLRQSIPPDSSCPGLSRASTSLKQRGIRDVDGRNTSGHDEEHDAMPRPHMNLFAKISAFKDERSARLAGIGLMLLSIFMFSFGDAMGKFLVATYSVGQLLLLRACAALIVLLPMVWRHRAKFMHLERPGLQLLRVALSTLEVAAFFLATVYLPLADVVTYYLACPIFVTALSAIVLRERVGWRRCSGVHFGGRAVVRQSFAEARAGKRGGAVSIFDDHLGGDVRLFRVRRRARGRHDPGRGHHHRRGDLYFHARASAGARGNDGQSAGVTLLIPPPCGAHKGEGYKALTARAASSCSSSSATTRRRAIAGSNRPGSRIPAPRSDAVRRRSTGSRIFPGCCAKPDWRPARRRST